MHPISKQLETHQHRLRELKEKWTPFVSSDTEEMQQLSHAKSAHFSQIALLFATEFPLWLNRDLLQSAAFDLQEKKEHSLHKLTEKEQTELDHLLEELNKIDIGFYEFLAQQNVEISDRIKTLSASIDSNPAFHQYQELTAEINQLSATIEELKAMLVSSSPSFVETKTDNQVS